MVIQHNMARIFFFFYHALAPIQLANHSDFFNAHACLQQESMSGRMSLGGLFLIELQPLKRINEQIQFLLGRRIHLNEENLFAFEGIHYRGIIGLS
jgi:hypothetical protein